MIAQCGTEKSKTAGAYLLPVKYFWLVSQGSEVPAFQNYATVVTASPPFLSSYSSETDDFITAVNDLPASFPTGGSTNSYVLALGDFSLTQAQSCTFCLTCNHVATSCDSSSIFLFLC